MNETDKDQFEKQCEEFIIEFEKKYFYTRLYNNLSNLYSMEKI